MKDACQCEYCLAPNAFYRQQPGDNARIVGEGTFSYPIRIRIRIARENINAILENDGHYIRFENGHRLKGFSGATTYAYQLSGERQTRRQGINELQKWTIHIEGVGSVPLSLIKMNDYFVHDHRVARITSFQHNCFESSEIETKETLSANPLFANPKCARVFHGNIFFRQALDQALDRNVVVKRAPKRSRSAEIEDRAPKDSRVENEDEDEDCTPTCEWSTDSPPSEWTARNLQDFLLTYRSRAPILLGIDGVIPPPGLGNPLMRVRLQHANTGEAIHLTLNSALLYTVPQYRAAVDSARSRFGV
jgi:hypothetical protein